MGVGGGYNIGPGSVNLRMDGEGGGIYGAIALNDFSFSIHQKQIGHSNMTKVHPERVNPEAIGVFWVSGGDVTGDAFIETVAGKDSKRGC
jgi:hypothetical protein